MGMTYALIQEIVFMLCATMVLIVLLKFVRDVVYAFLLDSAEVVAETISGLITVSAGTPGRVEILYKTPDSGKDFDVKFKEKSLFIERKGGTELEIPTEELEVKESQSTSAIDFSAQSGEITNFNETQIDKNPDGSIAVGVS